MSGKTKQAATKESDKLVVVPKLRFFAFRTAERWEQATLGEKASILKGKGISKADLDPAGSQPCIRYGELYTRYGETIKEAVSRTSVPSSELFLSKRDDVIIPSSGETKIDIAKASCVLVANIALGSDLNVIRSKLNGIFLSYYLNGPKRFDIANVAQGDAVVHLYPHQLEALKVAFPSPAEQQKIAECLSSVDEVIAVQARKVNELKIHKKSLLKQLFPREGETQPHFRFPEFRKKGGWDKNAVEEIIDTITPPKKLPTSEYRAEGRVPIIDQSQDYICGWTNDQEAVIEKELPVIVFGDHTCALKFIDRPFAQGADGIKIIRPKRDMDPHFLFYALEADPVVQDGYKRHFSILREKTLSFPALDSGEQQRITGCLGSLDALIATSTQKLEALKCHKRGLMQQLFPSPEEDEA